MVSLRGERNLRRAAQFAHVYTQGKAWANHLLVVKTVASRFDHARYGISINKRVGKAVTRNRIKRRLREVLRHTAMSGGWDIIVIVRRGAGDAPYRQLDGSVNPLLARAGIATATAKDNDISA